MREEPIQGGITPDDEIARNIMYCAGFLRHHTEGRGSRRRVLQFLKENGATSQQVLLEELGVRPSSLSELLSKLELKGLVTKEKSETDKRNYNVKITDEGVRAAGEMQEQYEATTTELLQVLDGGEKEQLSGLLEKLRSEWRRLDGHPSEKKHRDGHHEHGRDGRHGCMKRA